MPPEIRPTRRGRFDAITSIPLSYLDLMVFMVSVVEAVGRELPLYSLPIRVCKYAVSLDTRMHSASLAPLIPAFTPAYISRLGNGKNNSSSG
jgi:hypothetical protein